MNRVLSSVLILVCSFGTEDRPTDRPVAPRDEVYEYVIFRESEIKFKSCSLPSIQPLPTMLGQDGLPNDPAILDIVRSNVKKRCDMGNSDTTLVKIGGKDFSDYFLSELLSDFKILCEDVSFNCHKIILATGSPVFEAAVNSDMLEAKSGCLKIEDYKPSVVKFILEFIYKSEIDIKNLKEDPVFAMEVLAAADKYRMEKLKDLCEKKLCFQIVTENALELLIVGDMYGAAELKESAQKLIFKKKKEIVDQEEFGLFVKNHPELAVGIMKLIAGGRN